MMIKVKAILAVFVNSFIPQDKYFPKLLHIRLIYSVKYYISILGFLTMLLVVSLALKYPFSRIYEYKSAIIQSLSEFPQNVELRINKGVLHTNTNAPLFLWVKHNGKPLFVFMANERELSPRFQNPIPFVFLKKDGLQISFRQHHKMWTYNPLSEFLLSKEQIPFLTSLIHSYAPYVVGVYGVILLFLFPLIFMCFITICILTSSVLSYLFFRSYFIRIHFKKCLQAGLHGTHIPMIISAVLLYLFPFSVCSLPIVCALFFVFTLVSTFEMYSKEEPHHRRGR